MTNENTQSGSTNITLEQILAAVLTKVGSINIPLDTLVANYGGKTIAVNQREDQSVDFEIVDLPEQTQTESNDQVAGE